MKHVFIYNYLQNIMRFIWYFDKKALSSQCERKKGDIFKSYSFTGANVNAKSVLLNVGIKKRALTRQC
nr:MAG TPA: hypothetical protein [Caudoviricetes sp.]